MPRKTHTVSHNATNATNKTNATSVPTTTTVPTYEKPSFGSTILQGFALGTGQSLAFNMFRSEPVKEVKEVKENPKDFTECMKDKDCTKLVESFMNKEFSQCMKDNTYEDCKQYLKF